jgi:outer membrane murein-binding lipoprotein Lpp
MRVTITGVALLVLLGAQAYPTAGTWMADCPTAPVADSISYHWEPGPDPQSRPWCTQITIGGTTSVWRVAPPLDGIGLSPAFSTANWDSSDPANVVEITTAAQSPEETALVASLNAWYDARVATGTIVTRAEFDALATEVATLQAQVVTLQTDLAARTAEIVTMKGHLAAAGQ